MSERNITVSAFVNSAFVPEYCGWEETVNKKNRVRNRKRAKRNVTKSNINFTTLRSFAIFTQKTLFSDTKKNRKRAKNRNKRKRKKKSFMYRKLINKTIFP